MHEALFLITSSCSAGYAALFSHNITGQFETGLDVREHDVKES